MHIATYLSAAITLAQRAAMHHEEALRPGHNHITFMSHRFYAHYYHQRASRLRSMAETLYAPRLTYRN